MEEFNLDMSNLLSDEEYDSLVNSTEEESQTEEVEEKQDESPEDDNKDSKSTEVNEEDSPESVGVKEKDETNHPLDEEVSSPNTYSSIASAFKEDGVSIFSDLEEEELKKIDSADSFEELISSKIDAEVESRLNDVQRRINEALGIGLDPEEIKVFESSLANLKSISDEQIENEDDEGAALRKNLIFTDLVNRGFTKERAAKEVEKSFKAGTDIEDAKDALQSNLDFYQEKYNARLSENRKAAEKFEKERKAQAEALRKSILEEKTAFGEVEVDKNTRKRMYDVIAKPVHKDENGNVLTEMQKYERENHNDFMKYLAYSYVVTDGFKNLSKLEKIVERKATKKSISALEKTLKSTANNTGGALQFVSGVSEDEPFAGGWTLDVQQY